MNESTCPGRAGNYVRQPEGYRAFSPKPFQHYPITSRSIKTFLTRRESAELTVFKNKFVVPRKGISTLGRLDNTLVLSLPKMSGTLSLINFLNICIIGSEFCLFASGSVTGKITL